MDDSVGRLTRRNVSVAESVLRIASCTPRQSSASMLMRCAAIASCALGILLPTHHG